MTTNPKGQAVTGVKTISHSSQLQKSLSDAAKSLSSRPKELRGPFTVRLSNSEALSKKG